MDVLPPALLKRVQSFAADPRNGVDAEVLRYWEEQALAIHAAVQAARGAPRPPMPPGESQPERVRLAARHLRGEGIEIGALQHPLPLPPGARARNVDVGPVEELEYLDVELARWRLAPIDVIDDAQRLASFADASLDFVVSNHVLEHLEDPLGALLAQARVLRAGGVLFASVPDCRHTFDRVRPRTPLVHLVADHEHGPLPSRRAHYMEWSALVRAKSGREFEADWRMLEASSYAIHFHVWTPEDFLELFLTLARRPDFPLTILDLVVAGNECILVARKSAQ